MLSRTCRRAGWHALAAAALFAWLPAHAGSFEDFFSAVRRNDGRAITSLVARGFDPNTVNEKGQSGLMLALGDASAEAARALVNSPGINVEVRNASDESPLMLAALKGQLELVKVLVAKDADINKTGWTPLHYAATGTTAEQPAIVAFLLENHAYIDAASPGDTTPLMMAAYYGKADTVALLLAEGADPFLRNNQKLSAIDMAKKADRKEIAEQIADTIRRRQPNRGQW